MGGPTRWELCEADLQGHWKRVTLLICSGTQEKHPYDTGMRWGAGLSPGRHPSQIASP